MSPSATDDVNLMSRVVFTLFNQEEAQRSVAVEATQGSVTGVSPEEDASRGQVDILRALSAVLFENGPYIKDNLSELSRIIITVGESPKRQGRSEHKRMALNCLANLVHKTGSLLSSLHERLYQVILSNLTSTAYYESGSTTATLSGARQKERASERKLISSALRALHFLIQEDKNLSTRSIPPLIDVICRFMFFTSENGAIQPALTPSSGAFNVGVINRSSYPSSDSEYSDSESGAHQAQRKHHDGKVRLNALLCLQTLARGAPKQLQPHWPKFLTTSSISAPLTSRSHRTPSLLVLIGSDPISTVRSAACTVLGHILESSKQYLAMAEEKAIVSETKSHTGILTLSERVGLMTRELHVGAALAMDTVDSSTEQSVAIQIIKCCSSIVANCAYEKMRTGLPLLLFNAVKRFIDSTDAALQVAALMFTTALLSNVSARAEVHDKILMCSRASETGLSDTLSKLLSFVEEHQIPSTVRAESWNTMRAIAVFHIDMIRPAWPRLDKVMLNEQRSEDVRGRSGGLLFLEEYSKSSVSVNNPLPSEWWNDILERHVLKAFAEENPSTKALGCDIISNIIPDAFNTLPDRLKMLIMSLVLGTALDENATVRAAACHAIGVFILFPSIREDSTHAVDMASTVLDMCRDPNLTVRVRASWAVGNLCDSMVLLKTSGQDDTLQEILTLPLWTKIMRTALMISQDHEKIKSNGIRAIGGLLRVTFEGIMERERHSLVKEAVYALIKHMEHGSLKGRWNACYAMQNVLLNVDFPIGSTQGTSYAMVSDTVSWTNDVYNALLQAIQQSKNFKVRINACAALTVPKTRAKYGDRAMFRTMVQVLMKAVRNLDEEQGEHEFGEFQYRGQLETKLLRCLDHLLQLSGGVTKLDLELHPEMKQRIVASRPAAEAPPSQT
ncbi:HEAT repeat-containing protein 6 [Mortierella sp. GBA30]|nr:HEAT repeat-containing protein 6 [Mortierella sp. GBA30]